MAIISKEELIRRVTERIGDDKSDDAISFLEDVTDTVNSFDSEDWKTKYETNDKEWRERYIKRFTTPAEEPTTKPPLPTEEETKVLTYEELFKEEEK